MYTATTPDFEFLIDFDSSQIEDILLTFQQDSISVTKGIDDVTLDEGSIKVSLTQTETKKFKSGRVNIHARIKLTTGKVIPSNMLTIMNYMSLDNTEL